MKWVRDVVYGVLIGIAVVAIPFTLATRKPEPVPKANRIISFEDQWRAAGMTMAMAEPKRITVERVVLPEIIVAGATSAPQVVAEAEEPRANRKPVVVRDVCRGKGRVWVSKKRWKCRR